MFLMVMLLMAVFSKIALNEYCYEVIVVSAVVSIMPYLLSFLILSCVVVFAV